MKKLYPTLLTIVVLGFCATPTVTFGQEKSIFHAGFVYPISNHGTQAAQYSNLISLHAFAGVSREERAFAVSGFTLLVKENTYGFVASGFTNIIGGRTYGFTTSGFANIYKGGTGLQSAGFTNIAIDSVSGVQVSGFYNQAGNVHGVQSAGFLNKAKDVQGVQVAGFINIAQKVKGVQIAGFINIADSCAYPIGIINLVRNGEKALGITTDENQSTLLTFRSGGSKLYGIIGLGSNLKNNKEVFAMQAGLGAHLFTKNAFRLNAEIINTSLESFKKGSFTKGSLSILPTLRLGKVEIFVGPSINFIQTNSTEGKELVTNFIWNHTTSKNQLNGLYIGYTGGIQWKL